MTLYWNGSEWYEKTPHDKWNNIETETSTAKIIAFTDINKHIRCTNSNAITITIPLYSSVYLPVGFQCEVEQAGTGTITFSPESGVTLRSKDSNLNSNGQYGSVMLKKIDTDEWLIVGDLV